MKRTLIALALAATSLTAHAAGTFCQPSSYEKCDGTDQQYQQQTKPQRDIADITAKQQVEQEAQKYVLKVYARLGYEPAVAAQFAASKEGQQIAYIMRDAILLGRMNQGVPADRISPDKLDVHAKQTMLNVPVVAQNVDDDEYMKAIYITWAQAFYATQKGQ